MSEAFLPHAFESFKQEYRKGISEKNQGTGLGLAIVKALVTMMDGTITVESKIGVGTTFTVDIPVVKLPPLIASAADKQIDDEILEGLHILLCEDNEINTEIALALLEKKACVIDCAEDGLEGVNLFKQSEVGYYDLVLMDIRMPVMNGLEASKEIRKLNRADAKTIPIIAMTADAFNADKKISREAGMNAHLSKPIEPTLLYRTMVDLIKKSQNLK